MKSDTGKGYAIKISVLLMSLSLFLSACESEEEAAASHLKKGIELLEKGDYTAAKLELKTAKQGDAAAADTYYYLALSDEKVKDYTAMQDNLRKTLQLDPAHQQAHIKLGKLLLLQGKVDAALHHVDILLAKTPQDLDALALKSSVLLRQNKKDEALVIINQILERNPVHVDGLTLKAMFLMEQDQLEEALLLVDKAILENEKNPVVHLFKIKIHAKQNNVEAMINDYLRLIELFPDNDKIKITLAKVYTRSGNAEAAEQLLRHLVDQRPGQLQAKIVLLEFLTTTASEKLDEQIQIFNQKLANKNKQLLGLAKWMLAKDHAPRARAMLQQVIVEKPYSVPALEAKILLAKLAFDEHDYVATKKTAIDILAKVPDHLDAQLLQVRLLLVEEQYDQAKDLLDKMIWTHPKSDEALVLLAQIYLVQGDRDKSRIKFKAALELNPANIQAFLPVYNNLMAQNDLKYARELVIRGLRKNPQQVVLLQKLVQLNIQEEKWQEATKVAVELAKFPKEKNLAKFYLANIVQGQGEYAKAIVIYKQLISEFPEQLRVFQNLSRCYDQLNKRSEMIDFLQNHRQTNKNNIVATLFLSDLYVDAKQYHNAVNLLKTLIDDKPELVVAQRSLAKTYMAMGQPDKAISVYQQALKNHIGDIRLLLSLAALYEQQNSYDEAVQIYKQLIVDHPDLQVANNNLAVLLVEHFPTDANLQRALQLVESFADTEHAYYQDTYAWTILHAGRVREALGIFKNIILELPNVPVFRYHLGVAEYKDGNNSAALVQVDQAIELAKSGVFFSEQKLAEKFKKEIIAKIQGR